MTGKLSLILKKYAIPLILIALGFSMVYLGMQQKQDSTFLLAALMMVVAGLISALYSSGKLNPKITVLIGVVAGAVAIGTLWMSSKSVMDTTTYNENYQKCLNMSIQNLQDIRYIQKSYMEKNGTFLKTWEEFVEYAKTGTVPKPISKGSLPAGKITPAERDYLYGDNRPIDVDMTEEEAYKLSKWPAGPRYNELFKDFVRDTIQITFADAKFNTKSYKRSREVAGLPRFSIDSLVYIPYTGGRKKWNLETKDSVMLGETAVPAIFVHGEIPFAKIQGKKNEKLSFGRLTSNDMSGSWEE